MKGETRGQSVALGTDAAVRVLGSGSYLDGHCEMEIMTYIYIIGLLYCEKEEQQVIYYHNYHLTSHN